MTQNTIEACRIKESQVHIAYYIFIKQKQTCIVIVFGNIEWEIP